MDKIGDLILTLPVDQVFDTSERTVWFISHGLEFFPNSALPKRQFFSFSKKGSLGEVKKMLSTLKDLKPARAIVFHAPWWVSLTLWLARVPTRIGVRSKLSSYLFFNQSLRQKRSRAEKHEAEYGLELVSLGLKKEFKFQNLEPLRLASSLGDEALKKLGLDEAFIVVHPGMAGSALNWPTERYREFIEHFSEKLKVVITCGPHDAPFVVPLKEAFKQNRNVSVLRDLSLDQLTLVLQNSKGVLAPSTGVLHIAASLGVPSLGIYSPVGVERAVRWGPRGLRAETLTPESKNNTFDVSTVMNTLEASTVIKKFKEML